MKHMADLTKRESSVRFKWLDGGNAVLVITCEGPRDMGNADVKRMDRTDARKEWKRLKAEGFIPVILTGTDGLGARVGTLPDGSTATEFPGGGWVVHVPGTPNLYETVC